MRRTLKLSASLIVLAGTAIVALHVVHAPAPFLIGGLVGGAAFSLRFRTPWTVPELARNLGIATIGVGAGTFIDQTVISAVARSPVEIVAGVVVVIVFTMATGLFLMASPHVNASTALFASLGGAAAGVTAVAREMHADEAVVSAVQYARVVLVIISVAVVAPFLGGGASTAPAATPAETTPLPNLAFAVTCIGGGLLLARVVRFSGARLVMPMVLSMGVMLINPESFAVPGRLLDVGLLLTGIAVGFSFTTDTIRRLTRLFPLVLLQLLASIGGCAVLGILFARTIGISDLSGYLAMAPGGLPAVAALALEAGNDIGLLVTMQVVRLLAAILFASIIGSVIRWRGRARD
ncbi:MAG: AbrB family transcriptional regulator [Propionibacteriales bacterium]|nr:AbrB family transcriptional regulator [Propionibacteriales bacterium]